MPKGLKQTSSTVAIGFDMLESGANTFTQSQVDLNLSPLDREVFVVLAINLDPFFPDAITAVDTACNAAITTTSQTAMPNLGDANCLSKANASIRAAGFVDGGVGFMQQSLDTPPSTLEYIGIIATNDFFIQLEGAGNSDPAFASVRVWGYRAKADAAIYAALVQSEVLSS